MLVVQQSNKWLIAKSMIDIDSAFWLINFQNLHLLSSLPTSHPTTERSVNTNTLTTKGNGDIRWHTWSNAFWARTLPLLSFYLEPQTASTQLEEGTQQAGPL